MSEFPRMIYRNHGTQEIHGGYFDTFIVESDEELQNALADGWYLTPAEAAKPVAPQPVVVPDDAPPTRAELEQKASELRIAFDGRTSDAKLASKIAAALKEPA